MKVLKIEVAPGYWQFCTTVGEFRDACHATVGYEKDDTLLEDVPPNLPIKTEVVDMTEAEFEALPPLEI